MRKNIIGWLDRSFIFVTGIYQFVALVVLIYTPFLANEWLQKPFIGAFIEHTLALNTSGPSQPGDWDLQKRQFEFGRRLIAID